MGEVERGEKFFRELGESLRQTALAVGLYMARLQGITSDKPVISVPRRLVPLRLLPRRANGETDASRFRQDETESLPF